MMKSLLRLAGTAAAMSAAAACTVVATKLIKKAIAEASDTREGAVFVTEFSDTHETAQPAQTAEYAEQVTTDYYAAVRNAYDGGPNANPIYAQAVETPRTEDGKIDVTKLASPEDFCNWDELGCQS